MIQPHSQALMSPTLDKPLKWEAWLLSLPIERFIGKKPEPNAAKKQEKLKL